MQIKYILNETDIQKAITTYMKLTQGVDVRSVIFDITDDYDHLDRKTGKKNITAEVK